MRHAMILAMALAMAGCDRSPAPDATNTTANDAASTASDVADNAVVTGDNVANPADPATTSPNATAATASWAGRWVGPEGLYLEIKPEGGADSGRYTLRMKYTLDDEGTFEGRAVNDTILFDRAGKQETLRAGDGAATGMKWLAEKKDCLVVATGEGYCRD